METFILTLTPSSFALSGCAYYLDDRPVLCNLFVEKMLGCCPQQIRLSLSTKEFSGANPIYILFGEEVVSRYNLHPIEPFDSFRPIYGALAKLFAGLLENPQDNMKEYKFYFLIEPHHSI